MSASELSTKSVQKIQQQVNRRKLKKVPFVEIHGGHVAGIVSSGSDIMRVYVSAIQAGTMNFYCSTNNNRPCGGLGSGLCKHLQEMLHEAVLQYGAPAVAKALGLDAESTCYGSAWDIERALTGTKEKEASGVVFSHFLSYLSYMEHPGSTAPIPEMDWFHVG